MGDAAPPEGMSLEQQIAYARDLRRVYDAERARRRELEAANRALKEANAELDRRLYDLLAAQDWILAVNSSRELPSLLEALAQPLLVLLHAQTTIVFPWDPLAKRLGAALGQDLRAETPELAALRTSPLTAAILEAGRLWEVANASAPGFGQPDYGVVRALDWGAFVSLPLVARDERVGLLYVAWDGAHQCDERERTLLDLLAQHAAVSLSNARVLAESNAHAEALQRTEQQQLSYARDLRRAYDAERARRAELQEAYLATVKVLAAAIETRDPGSGQHIERAAALAVATARALGWDEGEQLERLELGAALHDVGKIGIEDRLLIKPGPLDAAEWEQMRRHPELGARLLEAVPFLQPAVPCVRHHQERYDGRGYPDRLAGEAIPVEARIVAVVDAFDAMTSTHVYRAAMTSAEALAELDRCVGTQFDPAVVAAFFRVVEFGARDDGPGRRRGEANG